MELLRGWRRTRGRGQGQNITFSHIKAELSGKVFPDASWQLIRGVLVENR